MGYCDTDNYWSYYKLGYTCTEGYDAYRNDCCNHAMYVFGECMLWISLFGCCMAMIIAMAILQRRRR